MIFHAVTGKKVNGMTIKPNLLATVPSPPGIRVRKSPVAFAVPVAIFFTSTVDKIVIGTKGRKMVNLATNYKCQ